MDGRRQFLTKFLGATAIVGIWLHPLFSLVGTAYAKAQRMITDAKPGNAGDEGVTPLDQFKTMGTVGYDVDIKTWRLAISGNVKNPLRLTYDQLLEFPVLEKRVVLVCPGFFSIHGRWGGLSMKPLLERAMAAESATRVIVSGHNGTSAKKEEFPLEDILSNKVFLAYKVNGTVLPEKHGYPLRVVADGYDGDDWVKYVYEMTVA